jgi:hypothetical protein
LLWLCGNFGAGIKTKQNEEGNIVCHFLSWTEFEGKLYYLTADCLKDARGVELRKHLGNNFNKDVIGHGAIDFYWGLNGKGVHKEFTDFSSPDGLPDLLKQAFLNGEIRGLPIPYNNLAEQILCAAARKGYYKVCAAARQQYDKVCAPAWKEYDKVCAAARKEYNKVCAAARKEYNKVCAAARKEYNKVCAPARKEYDKVCAAARKEYNKVCAAARKEYDKVCAAAWKEYDKVCAAAFWKFVLKKKNRNKKWQ